jgi:hypothetical protein
MLLVGLTGVGGNQDQAPPLGQAFDTSARVTSATRLISTPARVATP